MSSVTDSAREDLAFLRALADDAGAPPTMLGLHLLAVGAIYGANLIGIWAVSVFGVSLPEGWLMWSWAPGTALYLPVCLWISLKSRRFAMGPTARVFLAAWIAVGLIALPIVIVMEIARARTGIAFTAIWPALSFLLYGGAWAALGIIRRKSWHGAVALGCLATAIAGALLIDDPAGWLVMGVGLLLFMAAPGFALMRQVQDRG